MEINKYSNIPLYSQLMNIIIKQIEEGIYKEGSKIPSEQEFCTTYDISRPTVRQAINELTISGYLYKEKGKGTFVSKDRNKNNVKTYTAFSESLLEKEGFDNIEFLSVKEIDKSNRKVFDDLDIYDKVAEVRYVSLFNNEAIALTTSYIPLNMFPDVIDIIKENKRSGKILDGKYPYVPSKSRAVYETVFAGQSDLQALKIKSGQPLLRVENVLYSKSGQIVEVVISKIRLDKCKLQVETIR